ncbi:NigD-like C-terminal domain-containing protein [uncultured Prevotella sp.]|uniref:NigD1/NigD2 family lipoprotein n=1 Tax=uncultured Prevotella sp. TaxID=159272 RepID=UPI00266B8E81|nr:NigD-like C-terminal domain-containing protein [uncultured Prevotella sp.]
MMTILRHITTAAAGMVMLALAVSACSSDAYDTGDGSLSYMRADFVKAFADHDGKFTAAITDDDLSLTLQPAIAAGWSAPDTVCRALLYYDAAQLSESAREAAVRPVAIGRVIMPKVIDRQAVAAGLPTDPVVMETAWRSNNRKYINLGLQLKTGTTDGNVAAQAIGWVYTGSTTLDGGAQRHSFMLAHSQNGVPQYYSTPLYVSLSLDELPVTPGDGDEIEVSVNTYKGVVSRTFQP